MRRALFGTLLLVAVAGRATAGANEYFTEFVRLGTYQLESPEPERLLDLLSTIPDVESMFLYTSGYPNWDWEEPETISARLPQEWHERVFNTNADAFFRWPTD